ncbi:tetratricopeptide repeat protein [Streptomyces sp. FL07-04A]|uniref:tetratricopeptide repeat protein n=1 Tax=Streptomyces sp. FL07-04A TaxID=3028658 RepID=UPI0029B69F02|nr:tetratricopeptide repeat protein [Streptomyces sp. FL07-04A]MDX3575689.1 tetratricopeptide repeat protein [Streptomyces sp. FL07-04A]
MERRRVLGVQGDRSHGSGYVIASGLVLTSAHVVPETGAGVTVFRPGRPERCRGTVVWRGEPDGKDDAALVRLDDPCWPDLPGGPVRWGRLVTDSPGTPCQAWGVPDVAQRDRPAVDTLQPTGTVSPGDHQIANRHLVTLNGSPPSGGGSAKESPWGGLSGAALFCGDLLTGVVCSDSGGWRHSRLEAVPAYVLFHRAGFREALEAHLDTPVRTLLEPVEWQALCDPSHTVTSRTPPSSPAGLLSAREAVVPFHGRTKLLEQMRAWTERPGFGAWLVHGPGGQGKTRLAIRLTDELAGNWATLWLDRDAPDDGLPSLAATARPLLVVIDYAETRTAQVAALLQALTRHGRGATVKLLMLARTGDDWWEGLSAESRTAEAMLGSAHVTRLEPLAPDADSRGEFYRTAVTTFAHALGRMPAWRRHDWEALAGRLSEPREDGAGPGVALTLNLTALADLLDLAGPEPQAGTPPGGPERPAAEAEDRFLLHERRYWTTTARAAGLYPALTMTTLTDALATAFLAGSVAREEADALLRLVPGLHDQPQDRRAKVRDWMASVYPAAGNGPWDMLQPDRLVEVFVGQKLSEAPELAARLLVDASPARIRHLLTLYARAAAHPKREAVLREGFGALIVRHPASLMRQALQVVTQVERPQPILDALIRIVEESGLSAPRLAELTEQLPPKSQKLAPFALALTLRLVEMYRSELERRRRTRKSQNKVRDRLAAALAELCYRYGDVGRWAEALDANTECLAVLRGQGAKHSWSVIPHTALVLSNRSYILRQLGRREEALEASRQAVDIQRMLAVDDPGRAALGGTLNNLSLDLGRLGRRQEAIEVVREAVAIHRRLVEKEPGDAHLHGLAMSLTNLSGQLGEASEEGSDDGQSLAVVREAVAIKRELAQLAPDAHLPDLAGSLNNLSVELGVAGLREESLAAIREAVEIRRALAAALPDAHLADLAQSLQNMGIELADTGHREEGLEAVRECVGILRAQIDAGAEALTVELATGLHNLAVQCHELDRDREAFDAINEAVALREPLVEAYPDAHAREFRESLAVLWSLERARGGGDAPAADTDGRPPGMSTRRPYVLHVRRRRVLDRRRLGWHAGAGLLIAAAGVLVGLPLYLTLTCGALAAGLAVTAGRRRTARRPRLGRGQGRNGAVKRFGR